jgi:two-component system nitrogen regulation response regulator NtrX
MSKIISPQVNKQFITLLNSGKKRILIVDDEPDITLTFKIALESNGSYEVYTFNEPLKALANFKAHSYDLVITDIKMPKMNGCEFCQKLKEIDNDIKIDGNGNVEYNGLSNVKTLGKHFSKISPEDLNRIIQGFKESYFFT